MESNIIVDNKLRTFNGDVLRFILDDKGNMTAQKNGGEPESINDLKQYVKKNRKTITDEEIDGLVAFHTLTKHLNEIKEQRAIQLRALMN